MILNYGNDIASALEWYDTCGSIGEIIKVRHFSKYARRITYEYQPVFIQGESDFQRTVGEVDTLNNVVCGYASHFGLKKLLLKLIFILMTGKFSTHRHFF